MQSKIVIIGVGSVGSTIAYALMIKSVARHIYLVDINSTKVKGEVLDLNHCKPYVSAVEIHQGTYLDCKDADIIIITAGAKQKPGETRVDLLTKNIKIMKGIVDEIKQNLFKNQPVILIISNPVDILTFFAHKFSELPKSKVFGSGTVLDSSRLRFEISNHCKINAKNIHGYVIGEHGDTELALWSTLTIGGMKFDEFCSQCVHNAEHKKRNIKDFIFQNVKNAAYQIIEAKGYTNFAIGLSTTRIVEAILGNQHSILPVSSILTGEYGYTGLSISLPCIVGSSGVEKILEPSLSNEEHQKFNKSVLHIKKLIEINEENGEF
jgi:L-lactate dehydrogenase